MWTTGLLVTPVPALGWVLAACLLQLGAGRLPGLWPSLSGLWEGGHGTSWGLALAGSKLPYQGLHSFLMDAKGPWAAALPISWHGGPSAKTLPISWHGGPLAAALPISWHGGRKGLQSYSL